MMSADDFYCEQARAGQAAALVVRPCRAGRGRRALPDGADGHGHHVPMVEVHILAGEAVRHCGCWDGDGAQSLGGLEAALMSYETEFRRFVDQIQEGALENADRQWAMAGSAFGIGLMHCSWGLPRFSGWAFARLSGGGISQSMSRCCGVR
ncbi:hypothetical protein VTK56DRAFT_6167 [Thermocarpiscus australiensis]